MDEIKGCIDVVDDPDVLDRAIALLMQTKSAIQTSAIAPVGTFQKKDHFTPTQKK